MEPTTTPRSFRSQRKFVLTPSKGRPSPKTPLKKFSPKSRHSPKSPRFKTPSRLQGSLLETLRDTPSKKGPRKAFDRFIPSRSNGSALHVSTDYTSELARACGMPVDKRILAYGPEPPVAIPKSARWTKPASRRRKIAQQPVKVLDAPGIKDDFYLNLLDWKNNSLAIALDDSVFLWKSDEGSVVDLCQVKENEYVSSVQFSNDGAYLAVGTSSGDTQIWDIESSSKIRSMKGHVSRVGVCSWDKHTLSTGSRDGSIIHNDVRIARHKVAQLEAHASEVCGLKWRPDGQLLASGGNDNAVNIWDARSSTPTYTKTDHMAAVKAVAWCPWQLSLLATGGGTADKHIHIWNTTTGSNVSSVDTGSQVTSIMWSTTYKEFVSAHGYPDNQLSVYSYTSLTRVADIPAHESRILHAVLSPDGQTVATTAGDENLKFWKVFEHQKKTPAPAPEDDLSNAYKKLSIR